MAPAFRGPRPKQVGGVGGGGGYRETAGWAQDPAGKLAKYAHVLPPSPDSPWEVVTIVDGRQ